MIPKQDRQGVRHARDIEQKYNLSTDFSEIEKLATDAKAIAGDARSKAIDAKSTAESMSEDINELTTSVGIHSENIMNLDERVTVLEESGTGLPDEVIEEIVNEVITRIPDGDEVSY